MNNLIEKIEAAGLTGRGGAGFSTGRKWSLVAQAREKVRAQGNPEAKIWVIANGSEGELGVAKDGFILENYPERIIDGIKLAREVFDAPKAFLYLRKDYFDKYQEKLRNFIDQEPIELVRESGGYLGGEETTLIELLEGGKAEPREKPPYPTEKGFRSFPTLVNNLETFYAISLIARDEYEKKRFYSLSGDIPKKGVFELPEDWSVEKILRETGNFPVGDFFVQIGGGASGPILSQEDLKEKVCGSGAVIVYNQAKTDLKELLKKWVNFYFQENCGKCVPCREGVYRLKEFLEKPEVDWEEVKELALVLREASFCPLGKSVAVPLESFLTKILKK